MAKLTKADAARQLGISRTTLYKLIDQGKLSVSPDGLIDTAELVRVMSTMNVHGEHKFTPLDTSAMDTATSGSEHHERTARTSSEHQEWTSSERQLTSTYRDLVDILREQLQAAQERERDYREHIARLTAMLDQAHQQNQCLLDMPRTAPPLRSIPDPQSYPRGSTEDSRGEMRKRIVALLREHPEGLTPAQMKALLGAEKDLGDTCLGMRRDGLVQRVGPGRYVVVTTRQK